MKKNSKNRLGLNLLFLAIIFVLIVVVAENSFKEIFAQLAATSLLTLFIVILLGMLYQLLEGKVVQLLAEPFADSFEQKDGFFLSGSVAFYRVITLGAGTILSEIQFCRDKGMKASQGIGVTVLHMMMYKAAVLTYAVIGLVLQFSLLWHERPQYIFLVLFGIVVTALIILFLALLASSINLQVGVMLFCNRVFKRQKIRDWIDNLNLQIFSLRDTFQTIVKDRTSVLRIYYWSLFKLFFWYLIPYAILFQLHPNLNFLTSLFFISMVVVTAGVIPTPAGVGSFEFIYLLLFRPLVGEVDTLSSLLLYRFSTYVLPFLIGLVYVLAKKRKQISAELQEVRKEKENS